MGMLTDIAALAKAGYTAAEVKELLALANNPKQEAEQKAPASESQEAEQKAPASESQEAEQKATTDESNLERIAALEKQLAEAQAANRSKDVSVEKKSVDDILGDIARSFM